MADMMGEFMREEEVDEENGFAREFSWERVRNRMVKTIWVTRKKMEEHNPPIEAFIGTFVKILLLLLLRLIFSWFIHLIRIWFDCRTSMVDLAEEVRLSFSANSCFVGSFLVDRCRF